MMAAKLEIRHRVAIAGLVLNAGTGKPIADAIVRIAEMPAEYRRVLAMKSLRLGSRRDGGAARLDRTETSVDGLFRFLDLPEGKYTLAVSSADSGKRFGSARRETTVAVAKDGSGKVKYDFLEIGLQPTTVQGKVVGRRQKAGVVMAEVRVKGSGERVFSNTKGEYVLAGIEPGKRTIQVIAQGYRPESQVIHIRQAGEVATLNFSLTDPNSEGSPPQRGR